MKINDVIYTSLIDHVVCRDRFPSSEFFVSNIEVANMLQFKTLFTHNVHPRASPMSKRKLSSEVIPLSTKKSRIPRPFSAIKVATKDAAAAVDLNPPLSQLMKLVSQTKMPTLAQGKSVVFWMRMGDLRCKRSI